MMPSFEEILDRLKENEAIAQKFHEVETRILSILDFKDFFAVLLSEINDKFQVPYAWITIVDESDVSVMIRNSEPCSVLQNRINHIPENTFRHLIGSHRKSFLVNKNIARFREMLPSQHHQEIKSIAIVPITLDGKLIGTLNQADTDPGRFQPGMDTSLLERLAVKVSICLSNVTAHEKLRFLAYHDPLTGLLNRRVMEKVLQREFSRARRYFNTLSLVFIDLNKFKETNDKYGHDLGDHLLRFVADNLVRMSRDSDVVSRFAGDEFVLLLPETSTRQAELLMERIQQFFMGTPMRARGERVFASLSYGIATSQEKTIKDHEQLLKRADERLYEVKHTRYNPPDRIEHVG